MLRAAFLNVYIMFSENSTRIAGEFFCLGVPAAIGFFKMEVVFWT